MSNNPQTYSPSPIIETAPVTPFRAVVRGSAEHTCKLPTAAGARALGIVSEHSATAVGDAASVHHSGIVKGEALSAWAAGDRINIADDAGRLKAAVASLTTNMTNATNNDFVITALAKGEAGNRWSLELVDPGGTSATLSVIIYDHHIRVSLGRASSAIDTTAALLKTLLEANAEFAANLTFAHKTGNDGTGLVSALAKTYLSGGENDFATAEEAASSSGDIRRIKLDKIL